MVNIWSPKINKKEAEPLEGVQKRPNEAKLEAFKLYRNFLKSIIRRAKTVYFTKIC